MKFPVTSPAALLSLLLLTSCAPQDSKTEFVRSLGGQDVNGFEFASEEMPGRVIVSLTNPKVHRVLFNRDKSEGKLVLKYTRIRDTTSKTARTYKTELRVEDGGTSFVKSDLSTNQIISKEMLPPAPTIRGDNFDSLAACVDDWRCKKRAALVCEANRTCQDQFDAVTCCLPGDICYSVHFIVRPTVVRCELAELTPVLEGISFE